MFIPLGCILHPLELVSAIFPATALCRVYEALQALSGGMEPPGLRLAAYLVRTAHLPPGKDSLKTSMEGVLTLYDIKTLYLKVILENHCALYTVCL